MLKQHLKASARKYNVWLKWIIQMDSESLDVFDRLSNKVAYVNVFQVAKTKSDKKIWT